MLFMAKLATLMQNSTIIEYFKRQKEGICLLQRLSKWVDFTNSSMGRRAICQLFYYGLYSKVVTCRLN